MSGGTLTVKPMCAKLTFDTDWFTRMDPYVRIRVGDQTYKTGTAWNAGKNPSWSDVFTFKIGSETCLTFEILDSDTLKDDHVGSGTVELSQVFTRGTTQEWVNVNSNSSHKKLRTQLKKFLTHGSNHMGQIMFALEFVPQNKETVTRTTALTTDQVTTPVTTPLATNTQPTAYMAMPTMQQQPQFVYVVPQQPVNSMYQQMAYPQQQYNGMMPNMQMHNGMIPNMQIPNGMHQVPQMQQQNVHSMGNVPYNNVYGGQVKPPY